MYKISKKMTIGDVLRTKLSDEQFRAATDPTHEILCLACAGSGKSRTLAYRIARLLAEGNPPNSIVAFTFTEKAAESIKRRVADALEEAGFSPTIVGAMYIGTIHSYCKKLLEEMDAQYQQFEVLDENGLILYLVSRYVNLGLKRIRDDRNAGYFKAIQETANAWKIANDELLSYSEISQHDPVLGEILQTIFDGMDRDQFIDFSLMIRLVVEALQRQDPNILRVLKQVKHLMVDEYQDVNPSQESLISEMNRYLETLFVVGDDDQSIYGWRGADVMNIINFNERYPECSEHTLSTNFRSTKAIVETSSAFIHQKLAALRIPKEPNFHNNGNIRSFGNFWFETRQEEAEWVANRIKELLGAEYVENDGEARGLTKSDFAILFRSVKGGTPAHHQDFTYALEDLGIEYTIEAEGSIFERPHSRVLRMAMDLLRHPNPVNRRVARDFFDSWVLPHFPNADFNSFAAVLSRWHQNIHTPLGGARRKVYPQKLVHDLLEAFKIAETEFPNNHESVMRDLGVFSSIMLDVEKVYISIDSTSRYQEILNFLENIAETGYDSRTVELLARPDAVTVSTVHKMKGLEFPVVFIVDAVNQRFPLRRRNYNGWLPAPLIQSAINRGLYQTEEQGEARLFYTAITRAERILYVTGSASHPNLKREKRQSEFKLRLAHDEIITDPDSLPTNIRKAPQKRRVDDNSMPTSFTEIKDYLECPMKYKFRKIYGFSPAVPELFGYGLTIHTAINKVHQEFSSSVPSKEQGEEITENIFHLKHVFPSKDPERPGPFENARERAKSIVGSYVRDYSDDFNHSRQLEYRFEIKAGQAVITGSIDLLLRYDNGDKIVEATIIDFKTLDKPNEFNYNFWINLALQVQLYAYAAKEVLGENAKTGAVHLLKGKNSKESPNRVNIPVDQNAVEAALGNIKWAVTKILQGEFPMRPEREKCSECDFRQICAKKPERFSIEPGKYPPKIHIPQVAGKPHVFVNAIEDDGEDGI